MTGQELIDYLRVDILRDAAAPYLWSDELLLRRLSEAESIHARRTYSILDDLQTIDAAVDTPTYALPAGTMHVLSARVSTQAHDLRSFTRKAIPSHLLTSTGEPQIFTLDEATGVMRLYPVPEASYTINLRIARLPAAPITESTSPEIPERYHLDLAEYAAWRCLLDNDVDGKKSDASDRHRADWEMRVSDAKREFYRLQLGVCPHVTRSWTGKRG